MYLSSRVMESWSIFVASSISFQWLMTITDSACLCLLLTNQAAADVHTESLFSVMRLTKPQLMTSVPVMGEPWDMLGTTLEKEQLKDIRTIKGFPELLTGEMLGLPQSFGMIFLGETFSGFVTVHNDSQDMVKEVSLKVELLTPSGQRLLLLTTPVILQLDGGACEERIISHEVKELGEHSLICSATYTVHSSGEELFLRKFFKFTVSKPLDVKTKFMNMEDDILLEVQIQNITPHPMFLEVVSFDPAPGFKASNYNTISQSTDEDYEEENSAVQQQVFGKANYISPRNSQQYLYKISPVTTIQVPNKQTHVSVGKMDLIWRSKFGDRGRIQTGQLKAAIPPLSDLKLTVVEAPGSVQLEEPFTITCRITNTTNRPMRLRSLLEKLPDSGILWSGITGKVHSVLGGDSSMELKFSLIPVRPGLQNIAPVTFVDLLSNQKKYHFTKLSQVFVEHTPAYPAFTLTV